MLFLELLKADLSLLKTKLLDKVLDLTAWTSCIVITNGYLLQGFGMPPEFGNIQAFGLLASVMIFELHGNLFEMVADMSGRKHIGYLLTLPAGSNLTIISAKVAYFAINGLVSAGIIFPLIKILLPLRLNLMAVDYPRALLALLLISLFFGWFTIFVTSIVKNVSEVKSAIVRILLPMMFLGCFAFTYKVAEKISPTLSKLCLLSPSTYATEAIRSATLGPEGYLPFWLTTSVLCGLTFVAAFFGYRGLKNRLDFI